MEEHEMQPYWYKKHKHDKVWWLKQPDVIGELIISFDKKKKIHLFGEYDKMTPEEKTIFDKENPYWAGFFSSSDKDENRDENGNAAQDEQQED